MEKSKFLRMVLPFVVGAVFGLGGFWVVQALILPPGPSLPCATKISVAVAHQYSQNYLDRATTPTQKIKGFTIDNCMLNTMNTILGAQPTTTGFRIYIGADAGDPCWMICGLDPNGADMTGSIYSAKTNKTGPCPTVCDSGSPIPGQ